MMHVLMLAALLIWGIPLMAITVAATAALLSSRARFYLRRSLIAE